MEDQFRAQSLVPLNDTNESEKIDVPYKLCNSIEADGLFVRVLVDYDPCKVEKPGQVVPRSAISIRSGDILQLINITDREWWQVIYSISSYRTLKSLLLIVPLRYGYTGGGGVCEIDVQSFEQHLKDIG